MAILIGGVTIAMIEGELALVVWRAGDFREALEAMCGHVRCRCARRL